MALKKLGFIALLWASSISASIEQLPLVNYPMVLKNQVLGTLELTTKTSRDALIFSIAGMSLDAYILSLPLEAKIKARVVAQLSNPMYAIPLGHFLYMFYDRYAKMDSSDAFKQHLEQVYPAATLKAFQHSLYKYGESPVNTEQPISNHQHQQGLKVNRELIAAMVVLYDALVDIDEWRKQDTLPDQYTYLDHSESDLALVERLQRILMEVLDQLSQGMEAGEAKDSLLAIINTPDLSQALTVTIIDFVRLNVLKGYRQFVHQQQRQSHLEEWLQHQLDDDPNYLIAFLQAQQQRRFAVQITVDGLQQGLIQGLVQPQDPFIEQVAHSLTASQRRANKSSDLGSKRLVMPQQHKFLSQWGEQRYDDKHYLPFFHRLYHQYPANISRTGISSSPTISVRNLPIIKTGAKVSGIGGTGIPNFHFIDREQDRAYYFFGNDALQLDKLVQAHGMQTMFDRLSHLRTLNCNAQYDWNAHVSFDALLNLGLGEKQRDFGEKRCLRELRQRAEQEQGLRYLRQQLIAELEAYQSLSPWRLLSRHSHKLKIQQALRHLAAEEPKGMPDYLLVYNPWADHFAHFKGPFSDEIIAPTGELNRLDYWINQLEKSYKAAGVYSQTLWGMAGDHGLAPVDYSLNPELSVFNPLEKTLGVPLHIYKLSSDEGEGPKITNALNPPSMKAYDVVVASTAGGNVMFDFFNSQQGWQHQPIYSELQQWRPQELPEQQAAIDIVATITSSLSDSLDYLVLREQDCNEQHCVVRLAANRKGQRIDELIHRHQDKLFYQRLNPKLQSLLEIEHTNPYLPPLNEIQQQAQQSLLRRCIGQASLEDMSSWCDRQQWQELTSYSPRPDSIYQLASIYNVASAGTINLFPRQGIGYNTKVPGRHAGESYLEKDAFIGFWGAPVARTRTRINSAENGSLAPTLYHYLSGEAPQVGEDGWGYPSLWEQIKQTSEIK